MTWPLYFAQSLTLGSLETQHSSDQRELLNVLTIVDQEPTDPARFSHADWMPFSRESLGIREPDVSFSGYLGQFLQAERAPGVSYTYGSRMRDFDDTIDQVAGREHVGGRRLHLTAYFRSHDIYRAWTTNAYGLRALQGLSAARLEAVEPGDLAILSHSAHIYAHDWERADELVAHQLRGNDPRLVRDARGSFVIALEGAEIVVRHYTPAGEHLQTFQGMSARPESAARALPGTGAPEGRAGNRPRQARGLSPGSPT